MTANLENSKFENQERQRGEFLINTKRDALDINLIHRLLATETYWAKDRTLEIVSRSWENSLPFVIYRNDELCGFARVVTDYATFAWVADVFVRSEYRGQGLSKFLMQTIVEHPDLQILRRWVLATRDAHGLYRQFGFGEMIHPSIWMERAAPNAYASFGFEE